MNYTLSLGKQDGCRGCYGSAGGHTRHSCLCGQPVWEHGCQAASDGVCASGGSNITSLDVKSETTGFCRCAAFPSENPNFLSVLFLHPQTKDVTVAMGEGRFDDAVRLRGK